LVNSRCIFRVKKWNTSSQIPLHRGEKKLNPHANTLAAVKMNKINPKYENTRKIHLLLTNVFYKPVWQMYYKIPSSTHSSTLLNLHWSNVTNFLPNLRLDGSMVQMYFFNNFHFCSIMFHIFPIFWSLWTYVSHFPYFLVIMNIYFTFSLFSDHYEHMFHIFPIFWSLWTYMFHIFLIFWSSWTYISHILYFLVITYVHSDQKIAKMWNICSWWPENRDDVKHMFIMTRK
jgi:hypothetical protein